MPGLTGFWQVHRRSNVPFEERVGLEYLSVRGRSLWQTLTQLARTIDVVAKARGAY
jgi:lipopolysaccharide/colanic/teichoic acid biosynthesis glycosyltransferase